jgi:hypothetical protein
MEQSILKSTKNVLGLAADYTVFDLAVITHINSAFSTLTQLGVGPIEGFMIEDDKAVWDDFIILTDDPSYNSVKSYIYLKTRLLFDPPTTSFHLEAMDRQIQEMEWRLNANREEVEWVDPNPPSAIVVERSVWP